MAIISKDIDQAAELLRDGQLVAIPTETVYGLAANALNARAVADIFAAKERPSFDPLIIHLSSVEQLGRFVKPYGEEIAYLLEHYTPGPLTILFNKEEVIPDIVTSGLDTVAVRFPSHPIIKKLLDQLDFPLAAPSANPFGYISPTTAQHVQDQLGSKIPLILDGGSCEVGVESTIVAYRNGSLEVLRKGGMAIEELFSKFSKVSISETSSSNPSAPGMLKSHYSPSVPLLICDNLDLMIENMINQKVGVLTFGRSYELPSGSTQIDLSPKQDLLEAAQNLFAAMRSLDEMKLDMILVSYVPDQGLGRAINDRLTRASVIGG